MATIDITITRRYLFNIAKPVKAEQWMVAGTLKVHIVPPAYIRHLLILAKKVWHIELLTGPFQ